MGLTFKTNIAEQEDGADPCNLLLKSLSSHACVGAIGAVYIDVLGSCFGPEGPCSNQDLKRRKSGHYVKESPPSQMGLSDHGGRDERTDGGTQSIKSVQEPQQLVRLSQGTNPGIPGCVEQAISKACQCEDCSNGRVRGVCRNDGITDDFAGRCNDSNAAPTNEHVEAVAEKGSYRITGEGRKEDQGSDDIGQMIVLFDLESTE